MDLQLSTEQFNLLSKINEQKIMLIEPSQLELCEHLKSKGFIKFYNLLAIDSFDESTGILCTKTETLVVQITQEGIAYVNANTFQKADKNWDGWIALAALIVSAIALFVR